MTAEASSRFGLVLLEVALADSFLFFGTRNFFE
jgi:hypothetical protein